jgi:hypothetical protein
MKIKKQSGFQFQVLLFSKAQAISSSPLSAPPGSSEIKMDGTNLSAARQTTTPPPANGVHFSHPKRFLIPHPTAPIRPLFCRVKSSRLHLSACHILRIRYAPDFQILRVGLAASPPKRHIRNGRRQNLTK